MTKQQSIGESGHMVESVILNSSLNKNEKMSLRNLMGLRKWGGQRFPFKYEVA